METLAAVVRERPLLLFVLPFWLTRGRASLKRELASRARVDAALLPYDENLVAELRHQSAAGRTVVLATAADELVARRIADHLGFFDEVIASDGVTNLKRDTKARALTARFGEQGFDYVGGDRDDLPIWRHAHGALVVGSAPALMRQLATLGIAVRGTERDPSAPALMRALRVYQWAKNLLVFVPLLTAHRLLHGESVAAAMLAFISFSFVASAVYLANDLTDLEDDRRHPLKRRRALASGELPIASAIALAPVLLAAATLVSVLLPWEFGALLLAYVAVNLAYSLGLKRVALVDVFVLAGLYTLRILAGAAAIEVAVSDWLLAFSSFLFLSLALVKRSTEVAGALSRDEERVGGRGYVAQDGTLLAALGIASGYLSVLVFALYITSPQVTMLYRSPGLLWFAVPLFLYWISRMWLLAHRGRLQEDPLLFSLGDPASYTVGIAILMLMIAAA
jgi:4-hydroxybenzoate polyprenyltransferase